MGFRSTFVTDCWFIEWPDWFRKKYEENVYIPDVGKHGCLASKYEAKRYFIWSELEEDIQKCLTGEDQITLVWLHECRGITKVVITTKCIRFMEPDEWEEVEYPTHNYCYGCSDFDRCT